MRGFTRTCVRDGQVNHVYDSGLLGRFFQESPHRPALLALWQGMVLHASLLAAGNSKTDVAGGKNFFSSTRKHNTKNLTMSKANVPSNVGPESAELPGPSTKIPTFSGSSWKAGDVTRARGKSRQAGSSPSGPAPKDSIRSFFTQAAIKPLASSSKAAPTSSLSLRREQAFALKHSLPKLRKQVTKRCMLK